MPGLDIKRIQIEYRMISIYIIFLRSDQFSIEIYLNEMRSIFSGTFNLLQGLKLYLCILFKKKRKEKNWILWHYRRKCMPPREDEETPEYPLPIYKHPPKENQKSNPSKRHRERLNAELENLASLLPFEQNILTKLDKLSILRLAVSYLRIKAYFQANLKNLLTYAPESKNSQIYYMDPHFSEGGSILESLNGFIFIVNTNSEVFYASRTVEQYIGFHQSDIIHQSVFELIHSEDREEFKRHLQWDSKLPAEKSNLSLNEVLSNKEYSKYLERNFTVRFRCLLDNTSGFLTLDIVGRLNVLHGQRGIGENVESVNVPQAKSYNKAKNSKANHDLNTQTESQNSQEPILALFAIACPFGPPSLFELPQRESLFKSKHKVTLEPISIDSKGKQILGYTDAEFAQTKGYDLVHQDDLKYYANAHKELLKTGSCGLICYRLKTVGDNWQWLQSSMRIIYKSNKPECIIANHRPLTNEEGEELYYKRGSEYKLPYPCLYDFESNFGGAINSYEASKNFSSDNQSKQTVLMQNSKNSKQNCAPNSATPSPMKTKSSKTNKAQLIQQRAQQHAQQHLTQNNYSAYSNDGHYKVNPSYMPTSIPAHNLDYYSVKTEADESMYDSKLMSNHITSDYSSASSTSSASSSSDSISVNIANPNYHYNYFNTLNQSYYHDANKLYPAENQFQVNLPTYELLNCANNAAALAAAKYSCAAAASGYGVYPFANDEYQPAAVSQIQL
ncbi:aryl hydrocarbon receptor [Brachionus plicatilis]|uniref:Aryl hydrocarbon receptor n=1 Tax=Brachionus plicatilis TaxID=10195 RepID=A0A3M7SYT6_BRAPC|nr:aryl hydrocarbon receptor [Brachionus plicatilis]